MCRLRPGVCLCTSIPRSSPPSEVLTLWLSMIAALGCGSRPSDWRTFLTRGCIDLLPQPRTVPVPIISIHRLPRRKILGQHAPLATCSVHIQDRIDNLPVLPYARASHFIVRKEFQNQQPFGILQVGRVSLGEFGHSPILLDHL